MTQAVFQRRSWIVWNFLAWVVGVVLVLVLSAALEALTVESMQFPIGVGLGATLGFAQQRLLRPWVAAAGRWWWYSVLGLGLPFLFMDLLTYLLKWPFSPYQLLASVLLGGACCGYLQGRLLPATLRYRWLGGSTLSWLAAALAVLLVSFTKYLSSNNLVLFLLNLSLILSGGLFIGLLSANALRGLWGATQLPR